MSKPVPKIIIIAGPNGAGKTTFAEEFLPNEAACRRFINADMIAAGLSPFDPVLANFRAGRLMLEEIHHQTQRKVSFALETTLSGRGYARLIPQWRASGYQVKLIFLRLASAELAIARVKQRVREGGHDIPETTIRRRFLLGLDNLTTHYQPCVNEWALYDNSYGAPQLIAEGVNP